MQLEVRSLPTPAPPPGSRGPPPSPVPGASSACMRDEGSCWHRFLSLWGALVSPVVRQFRARVCAVFASRWWRGAGTATPGNRVQTHPLVISRRLAKFDPVDRRPAHARFVPDFCPAGVAGHTQSSGARAGEARRPRQAQGLVQMQRRPYSLMDLGGVAGAGEARRPPALPCCVVGGRWGEASPVLSIE